MKITNLFAAIIASAMVVCVSSCNKDDASKQFYNVAGEQVEIGSVVFNQNAFPNISSIVAEPSVPGTFKGKTYTQKVSFELLFPADRVGEEVELKDLMLSVCSTTNYVNFAGSLGTIVDGGLLDKYPAGSYMNTDKTRCACSGTYQVILDKAAKVVEVIVKNSSLKFYDDKGQFLGTETLDFHFKSSYVDGK